MRFRLGCATLGMVLAISCGEGAGITPAPTLDGTWQMFPLPGSNTILTLTQRDSIVSGSGTWTGEACCSGTLTVGGRYVHPRVDLTLTYDNGSIAEFSGHVIDASHMVGTEAFNGGTPDTVTFTRR